MGLLVDQGQAGSQGTEYGHQIGGPVLVKTLDASLELAELLDHSAQPLAWSEHKRRSRYDSAANREAARSAVRGACTT